MDPDELRRLSESAVAHRIEKERQFVAERDAYHQRLVEEAIDELGSVVVNAANRGQRTAIVYSAHENIYLPRMFKSRRKEHWWTGDERIVTKFVGRIPDYAQYVFDHCPKNLKPRWETNGSAHTIELHVRW